MMILALLGMLAVRPESDAPHPSGRPHLNECPFKRGMSQDVLEYFAVKHRNEAQNR